MLITPRYVAALSKKRPLFDFDFIFNQSLDPRISFSRTTIGTRFNSAGLLVTESPNVPRFDYDPATLSALGLLVEPQDTNLLLDSEGGAAWSTTAASISSNITTAPDGTVTADKLIDNTANASHYDRQTFTSFVAGTVYTYSRFVKMAERPYCILFFNSVSFPANSRIAWFNLQNGTIGTVNSGVVAEMQDCGNGWYRCSIQRGATSSGSDFLGCATAIADGSATYVGDGTSGIYTWGAQLGADVAGPYSYVKTTSSQVTRTADVPQITIPQPADILVQDREGGAWITGIPAGPYTMAPRTDKRHIARWRAFPAGYAASHPELAVAYP